LTFEPLTDLKTFENLALFPNIVDELRDVPVHVVVPKGYGRRLRTAAVFESGGPTVGPKRVIIMPNWEGQVTRWRAVSCWRRRVQQPP
jgi:hypothetical protein